MQLNELKHYDEDTLVHFGVKGMKWGVRRNRDNGGLSNSKKPRKPLTKQQKAAIAGGVAAVVGLAAAAYILKNKADMKAINAYTKDLSAAKSKIQQHMDDNLGVVMAPVNRELGYKIRAGKGIEAESYMLRGGLVDKGGNTVSNAFNRFGKNGDLVGVAFPDRDGRRDSAGRPIINQVVMRLPKDSGINNAEDFERVIWPRIRGVQDQVYGMSPAEFKQWSGRGMYDLPLRDHGIKMPELSPKLMKKAAKKGLVTKSR